MVHSAMTIWRNAMSDLSRSVLNACFRRFVAKVSKFLDHPAVEGRNVVGVSARDQPVIDHDCLVHPLCPGVLEIGLERRPGGHLAALDRSRFNEGPGAVTDCSDGLTGIDKGFDKAHGFWIHAQLVRVHHAARQHQGIKLLWISLVEWY